MVCGALLAAGGDAFAEPASAPLATWGVDGDIYAVSVSGSTAYIGGNFSHVGPLSRFAPGSFVALDQASGQASGIVPRICLSGDVYASAPDGSGGWYIGGHFSCVGDAGRATLAHLEADGTVDERWAPTTDGYVLSLAVSGSTVYVGGSFTRVNGSTPRNDLAAFDATTGAATSFDPNVDGNVRTLALSGSVLYAGGDFTTVNGTAPRHCLAAFDLATGSATGFDPNVGFSYGPPDVRQIAVAGSTLYAAGLFDSVNGTVARHSLAAFDVATGAAMPFDPNIGGGRTAPWIESIALAGNRIYVGGGFTTVNGSTPRNGLAAFDVPTGVATSFDPNVTSDFGRIPAVNALAVSGSAVYAGGHFTYVNGTVARVGLAAFDATTGAVTGFEPTINPGPGGNLYVDTIGVAGGMVYAGGTFASAGGSARSSLAAIDLTTGAATGFDPNVKGVVFALGASGATVYAGGTFQTVNGSTPRHFLAAFDGATGTATPFDPEADGFVWALAAAAGTVYAGGDFTTVNGTAARNHLAAFDGATGAVTGFDPNLNGPVRALAAAGSTVYAGGHFTTVNGSVPRDGLAAVDAGTGAVMPFDATVNGSVYALAAAGPTVYVGGEFTTANGSTVRNNLAAFDGGSGAVTGFDPNANGDVYALAVAGSTVYAAGRFTSVNGSTARYGLASFDTAGAARPWDPGFGGTINQIAVGSSYLAVGGVFASFEHALVGPSFSAFAGMDGTPSPADLPTAPRAVAATPHDGSATITFSPPASAGSSPVAFYTVIASPGGARATGPSSPITMTGLQNGAAYSFSVVASNSLGSGPASVISNTVTPAAATSGGSSGGGAGGGGGGGGGGGLSADLQLTGGVSPQYAAAGESLTWQVRVTDANLASGVDVWVDLQLSANLSVVSSSVTRGPGCAVTGPGLLHCFLDWMSGGAPTADITLVTKVETEGDYTVTATTGELIPDPVPANNTLALKASTPPPAPIVQPVVTSTPKPTIRIVKATAAKTGVVTVRVAIAHWTVNGKQVKNAKPSTGYWLIYVDGKRNAISRLPGKGLTRKLAPGLHRIQAELVGEDGKLVTPRVRSRVVVVRVPAKKPAGH